MAGSNLLLLLIACGKLAVSWSVLLFCWFGLGLVAWRAIDRRQQADTNLSQTFWLGFVVSVGLSQIFNLFAPANATLAASIVLLASCGWIISWKSTISAVCRARLSLSPAFVLLLTPLVLILVLQALGPCLVFDTGLYHYNAVRWSASYPCIPGLANLHYRLGFNSSYFTLPGVLESTFWSGRSFHVVNSLLVLALVTQLVWLVAAYQKLPDAVMSKRLFALLVLPGIFFIGMMYAASLSPDLPVAALEVVISLVLLDLLTGTEPKTKDETDRILIYSSCLCFLSITVKLTGAVFCGLAFLCIVYLAYFRSNMSNQASFFRHLVVPCAAPALILAVPWLIHGYYQSGYIAFPLTDFHWDCPWTIPEGETRRIRHVVMAWARQPHVPWQNVLSSWRWLPGWYHSHKPLVLLVAGSSLFLAVSLLKESFKPKQERQPSQDFLLALSALSALVVWFFGAPGYRFAGALPMIYFASALILCAKSFGFKPDKSPVYKAIFAVALVGGLGLATRMSFRLDSAIPPLAPIQRGTMHRFVTKSGLIINVCDKGDRCFDSALPSTPYPNARLKLRNKNSMADGFIVDNR